MCFCLFASVYLLLSICFGLSVWAVTACLLAACLLPACGVFVFCVCVHAVCPVCVCQLFVSVCVLSVCVCFPDFLTEKSRYCKLQAYHISYHKKHRRPWKDVHLMLILELGPCHLNQLPGFSSILLHLGMHLNGNWYDLLIIFMSARQTISDSSVFHLHLFVTCGTAGLRTL